MSARNRRWVLAARPEGAPKESDFSLEEVDVPEPAEGELLVRNLYLSFDPAQRSWISKDTYLPAVPLGDVVRAVAVGRVVASRHPDFAAGDLVRGMFGWQDYALTGVGGAMPVWKLPPEVPPTLSLGALGATGLAAYFGLLEVGRARAGEVVVVSGAAGATGSVAAQIARIKGCRVIGVAGGPEKCRWLLESARLDGAIDYKSEAVEERLLELCPDGVDVFFDNVGGEILDAVLANLALNARIALCGAISRYNAVEPPPGPRNYGNLVIRRARMEGFLVLDFKDRFGAAMAELAGWIQSGALVQREDVQEGLENAPRTFLRLFEGRNHGKQLLKVAD